MTRTIITLSFAVLGALASCERAPQHTVAPAMLQPSARAMEADAAISCELEGPPSDAPQCECVGGTPRAELGDGHMVCEAGETELARIQYGIQAGVCCQPVVPMAVAPLPPGVRGRRPPAVIVAEAYPGAPPAKARGFRRRPLQE